MKQQYIVNSDLKMGKGKIAAQVAHGAVVYINHIVGMNATIDQISRYNKWMFNGMMKKIVLNASELEIKKINNDLKKSLIWCSTIHDMGLTQIAEGSLTVLVIEPLEDDVINKYTNDLKLL